MGFTAHDNTGPIYNQTKQRASIFLRTAAEQIVQSSTPGTPRKQGNLRQDVLKVVSGLKGRVEWRKGYAEYQERGSRKDGSRRVRNYTTPGTGPHYAQNAVERIVGLTANIARLAHLI